ncbi:hypothetical protein DFH06DRAFT_1171763 [Mycena polygramma]|nr:hypothetical protein DFH06DRAFT_1171763 [Mycena polygramma]
MSDVPQSSGKYEPPPLPPINLDLVVKVGDTVRIRPWADQFTWIEGRVEKADLSLIRYCKPYPRYVVSYTEPDSKHLTQRLFCPQLSEIMVREPNEPTLQPLPMGLDQDIYVCIPPLVVGQPPKTEPPVEKTWAHARILKQQSPPDANDTISMRVLVGPSKNLLFDDFPMKYTLPFTRFSRTRLARRGYTVAGSDEHHLEEEGKDHF